MLVDQVEDVIGSSTRAMLVPDLVGGVGDWDRLREIADRHNLKLIHDSCDTLGGSLRGTKTATRSDISVTSFSIYHIITALGNGGMVFFDDDSLLDTAPLSLRAWGRSSEKYMFGTRWRKATAVSLRRWTVWTTTHCSSSRTWLTALSRMRRERRSASAR